MFTLGQQSYKTCLVYQLDLFVLMMKCIGEPTKISVTAKVLNDCQSLSKDCQQESQIHYWCTVHIENQTHMA